MAEIIFSDPELKQIHKFMDSGIMHEALTNTVFDMPESTDEQLEQIEIPDNIEIPKHSSCKCEYIKNGGCK